ncbi:transglutaminase-like domain-containing protein [Eisenibacter elegans]|jgi:regulator of sirC expression with transglutaminase-like and TPR domain|uniref:transglutaminase-like domain-containing protein n=1 Tax=Eisenibacter elegans TaxID=997 RepID=UPI00042A8B5F|nr:transglutaminase-like domain-containing protein [Eisenibacter elegans]
MNNNEIKALVSLLEDDDFEIRSHVEQKIMAMGEVMIPFLETEWESNFNANVQKRIEDLLHNLQFNLLKTRLREWLDNESDDLLKGIWLVATYQYPDLPLARIRKEVEKIYYEVWMSHRTYASPFDQIKNLNNVFFGKFNFVANTQNYHAPSNSMINNVLEARRGNPISLCTVYMLVANQLRMPVYGVNLPNLFVLTYKSPDTQFYINVFNKGIVFAKADIDQYVAQLNLAPSDTFYEPCTHIDIIRRVLRNLSISFEKLGEAHRVDEIRQLLDIF